MFSRPSEYVVFFIFFFITAIGCTRSLETNQLYSRVVFVFDFLSPIRSARLACTPPPLCPVSVRAPLAWPLLSPSCSLLEIQFLLHIEIRSPNLLEYCTVNYNLFTATTITINKQARFSIVLSPCTQ